MPCIDRFHDVSPQNKKSLLNFEKDNHINGKSEATIKNYTKYLCCFARHLSKKPFADVTKKDVENFFTDINTKYNANSQDGMKIALRYFYRWLNGLEKGDKLPECVRWLKTRTKKQKEKDSDPKKSKKRIVTEDEYNCLMDVTRGDLQAQAMIETLNWYGCRISELLSMTVDDVEIIDIGVTITIIDSKTKPREETILTKEHYPQKLLDWLDNHPNRGQKGKPLWISTDARTYHRRLTVSQAEKIIGDAGARIGKHITPHDFRHTCITRDGANGISWTFVAAKHGLTKNSCQQALYDHNDHEEFLKHYRAEQGIVVKPTYNEIEKQKEKLEQEYNTRIQELERKFARFTEIRAKDQYPEQDEQQELAEIKRKEEEFLAKMLHQYREGKLSDPGVA